LHTQLPLFGGALANGGKGQMKEVSAVRRGLKKGLASMRGGNAEKRWNRRQSGPVFSSPETSGGRTNLVKHFFSLSGKGTEEKRRWGGNCGTVRRVKRGGGKPAAIEQARSNKGLQDRVTKERLFPIRENSHYYKDNRIKGREATPRGEEGEEN